MKFIYFDIGNVFLTFDKIFTQASKDLNIDSRQIDEAYEPYDVDANLGIVNIPEVWEKICHQLKIENSLNYNIIKSWVSDYVSIYPTHDLVKSIQAQNKYKFGIISNYYRGYFEEATRQGFIPQASFSPIIISAEVGHVKPKPEIYKIAEDKCGYHGSDIFFVDDRLENLDEATRHGWQTFLFDYKNPQDSVDKLRSILL